MKKVIFMFAVLGSVVSARAGTVYPQYPLINGISADNLCDAGSTFNTVKDVEVCTQWENHTQSGEAYQGNDYVCVRKSKKSVSVAKTYIVSTCLDAVPANSETDYPTTCKNLKSVEKSMASTISVPLMQDQGEAGIVQVGKVSYTIPNCQ